MTTYKESKKHSKERWLGTISTALHVGCNRRSFGFTRINRGKFLGTQIPYRSGFCGDHDA